MKLFILTTESWGLESIKEACAYLKPFNVSIQTKAITFDATNPTYYDVKNANSTKGVMETKSIKSSIIKALGISHGGLGYDCYGIIVDKAKSLETLSLVGQHENGTIEIYARKKPRRRYGMNENTYTLVHEILHALAEFHNIPDGLHDYLNTKPKNLDSYVAYLSAKIADDKVKIRRINDNGVQTIGILKYKDFMCYTLELAFKDNKSNVSCIPKGIYKAKFTHSPKFKRKTYELQGVKGRSSIRIHSGNYHTDIQGCILLGDNLKDINKDGHVDILNSTATIKKFEDLFAGKDVKIVIE